MFLVSLNVTLLQFFKCPEMSHCYSVSCDLKYHIVTVSLSVTLLQCDRLHILTNIYRLTNRYDNPTYAIVNGIPPVRDYELCLYIQPGIGN